MAHYNESGQLHDRGKREREQAAMRLGQMGRKARTAESSLVDAIEDQRDSVRCTAALAISAIGGDWRALVPLLDDKVSSVRQSAAKGIVRSGGDSRLAVRKLLDEAENPARFSSLGTILPSFGPDPTLAAIPVLIDAVASDDPAAKQTANELLRECLPVPPPSAVPLLTEYLAHSSADARIAALRLGNDARQAAARS